MQKNYLTFLCFVSLELQIPEAAAIITASAYFLHDVVVGDKEVRHRMVEYSCSGTVWMLNDVLTDHSALKIYNLPIISNAAGWTNIMKMPNMISAKHHDIQSELCLIESPQSWEHGSSSCLALPSITCSSRSSTTTRLAPSVLQAVWLSVQFFFMVETK